MYLFYLMFVSLSNLFEDIKISPKEKKIHPNE